MKSTDHILQVKRFFKKKVSMDVAIRLKTYIENNFPEDQKYLNKMHRQIACTNYLQVYDNETVKSYFCGQKTCLVCNSIRLAKFLDKYLDVIEEEQSKYHMVLSIRNPGSDKLKQEIDSMYKFFNQSSVKRNKTYRELNKKVKFIRSFESTLNTKADTYNIHFHLLLASASGDEAREYGEILIEYWLKYFKDKSSRNAQYLEPQEKQVLENFKYLVKLKDLKDENMRMFYNLLKATEGKRLFTAKNIKRHQVNQELKNLKVKDTSEESEIISWFIYLKDYNNWINKDTGEIWITDNKEKEYNVEMEKKRNLKVLSN